MRRLVHIASLIGALVGVASEVAAAPMLATFQLTGILGSSNPLPSLPSNRYTAVFDFDSLGSYRLLDGTEVVLPDLPLADRFYAHVNENYYSTGPNHQNQITDQTYGQWTQFPDGQVNTWIGGAFGYKTRVSFVSGSDVDYTTIDGFWPELMATPSIASLFQPGAMWLVYDTDRWPSGGEYSQTFVASLVSVNEINEPASLWLACFAVAASIGAAACRSRAMVSRSSAAEA